MYFANCEKESNSLFSTWGARTVAFDTMRRHLFYTNIIKKGEKGTYKAKVKVSKILQWIRERQPGEGEITGPKDLYIVEIFGETRTLSPGEVPAPGPLLCPSTGLQVDPNRFLHTADQYLKDRFYYEELYEALRDQFIQRREALGIPADQANSEENKKKPLTIPSPRTKHDRTMKVQLRFRFDTEYAFRRFYFVVLSVLGYDKLNARPYRGLPPYDPRNGVFFAELPLYVWRTFKELGKTCFYSFLRGSLIGRHPGNKDIHISMKGAFLCVTYDMVLIFQDTGKIPIFTRMIDVKEFYYNAECNTPFLAFLTDRDAPDLIFIPQAPTIGVTPLPEFDCKLETLRLEKCIREICFGSLSVRRVIKIKKTPQPSVKAFVEHYERKSGEPLVLSAIEYAGAMQGPVPQEHLAAIWEEAERVFDEQDSNIAAQSAIPLYANNANNETVPLSKRQLQEVAKRLYSERRYNNSVAGMRFSEAEALAASAQRGGTSAISREMSVNELGSHQNSVMATGRRAGPNNSGGDPLDPENASMTSPAMENNSFLFNVSFANESMANRSFGYGGAAYYLKRDEMSASKAEMDKEFEIVEGTASVHSNSSSTSSHSQAASHASEKPPRSPVPMEWNVEMLVNESFSRAPIGFGTSVHQSVRSNGSNGAEKKSRRGSASHIPSCSPSQNHNKLSKPATMVAVSDRNAAAVAPLSDAGPTLPHVEVTNTFPAVHVDPDEELET